MDRCGQTDFMEFLSGLGFQVAIWASSVGLSLLWSCDVIGHKQIISYAADLRYLCDVSDIIIHCLQLPGVILFDMFCPWSCDVIGHKHISNISC